MNGSSPSVIGQGTLDRCASAMTDPGRVPVHFRTLWRALSASVQIDVDLVAETNLALGLVRRVILRCAGCRPDLDDENRPPATSIVDAPRNYDIVPVLWSHRDDVRARVGGLRSWTEGVHNPSTSLLALIVVRQRS